jgi:glutathione reductase (NADPH)
VNVQNYDFDLFVVGAGSGGVRASRVATSLGARVAIAEERYLGGTCVNVGCIPKKLLVYASEFREAFEDSAGFGWSASEPSFNWTKLITNKNAEIARLNAVYESLLTKAHVKIFRSHARIDSPHTIALGNERITAKYILIATGGWPTLPQIPGAELAVTSNEAFYLEQLPERIVIVGGGYIGLEFAGIFHGLGARVTLIHRGELLLRGFDDELRVALATETRKRGIDLRLETLVTQIDARSGGGVHITPNKGAAVDADLIMFATGRTPNTKGIGLQEVGIALDKSGAATVDAYSRTSVESIYAIGDVTNRRNLTPVAIAEGRAVAETLFGTQAKRVNYDNVPSAVFCQPQIATVGLTETQARERYGAIDIYKSRFLPLKHTLSGRDERTLMKLIADRKTNRVVGCHMMGTNAAEIIQGFAVALQCGATKEQFDATIGIHPTSAEEFVTMVERSPSSEGPVRSKEASAMTPSD